MAGDWQGRMRNKWTRNPPRNFKNSLKAWITTDHQIPNLNSRHQFNNKKKLKIEFSKSENLEKNDCRFQHFSQSIRRVGFLLEYGIPNTPSHEKNSQDTPKAKNP